MAFFKYIMIAIIIAYPHKSFTQCSSANVSLGGYNNSNITFNTYAQLHAGATAANSITLSFNIAYGTNCMTGWSVKVRVAGNYTNGTSSIAPIYTSIQFASSTGGPNAGINTAAVSLSTTDQLIMNATTALNVPPNNWYYYEYKFNYSVQGGNHLIQPNQGTFSNNLIFSFYNASNQLVSTKTIPISFVNNVNVSCTPLTLQSYYDNAPTFSTYAEVVAGGTASNGINLQWGVPSNTTCTGFSLKVRATGDFVCGASTVSPAYASIKFNSASGGPSAAALGLITTPIQLSTSEITLISNTNTLVQPPPNNFTHLYDLIIQGGTHLIKPDNGTYTTSLVFSLYDSNNQLLRSTTVNVSFHYTYSGNYQFNLQLAGGASNVSFNFNSGSTYTNGISIMQNNALSVLAHVPYEIIAKTDAPDFTSSNTNPLAVSVLKLQASMNSQPNHISTFSFPLSAMDQTLIRSTQSSNPAINFHLRYFTDPGNTIILNADKQHPYTTTITLVAVAL